MRRAGKIALALGFVVSIAIGMTGYITVLITADVDHAAVGFIATCVGLGLFLICMHAWTDLR